MNQEKSRLQTILIDQLLSESAKKEDFNAIVINDYQTSMVVFRIEFTAVFERGVRTSLFTSISKERSMFGKGIRLLLLLDKKYSLMNWLSREGVTKIIVTNIKDPSQMNSKNHCSFSTEDLKELLVDINLLAANHPQAYEIAVQGLIAQNTK
jgi:hypothetical protein